MSSNIPELLDAAQHQIDQGQISKAIEILQYGLETAPADLRILNGLSKLTLNLRQYDAAANYAMQLCKLAPTLQNFHNLAYISKRQRNYKVARTAYLEILRVFPYDSEALVGIADLYARTGYQSLSAKYYELGLTQNPSLEVFAQYAKSASFEAAPRLLKMLTDMRARICTSPKQKLLYNLEYATRKEHAERAARSMPQLAQSVDDLFFKYAVDDRNNAALFADTLLEEEKEIQLAMLVKALSLTACDQLEEAEVYYQRLAKDDPTKLYANIVFNDRFFFGLEQKSDDVLTNQFPPITNIKEITFGETPIIFLSCDFNYFKNFARPLLTSLDRKSPHRDVQLHVINPPAEGVEMILAFCATLTATNIAIMIEHTPTPTREYFHAARFVRLYQHMLQHRKTVWLLDVDGILNRDIAPWFELIAKADISLRAHTGIWAPWNQLTAGVFSVTPTELGFTFMKLVAHYIGVFVETDLLRWGVDQIAMYATYAFLRRHGRAPTIGFFDDLMLDDKCSDDAVMWSNSGVGKFDRMTMIEDASVPMDAPKVKYLKALNELGYSI
jgi:tetratricopeptide (TPR) repeat protein